MKMRYVLGILAAFVLAAGLVSATPAPATVSGDSSDTWSSSATAGTVTVDGGYIYPRNLEATMQTMRWAAIYGNVTGTIVLAGSAWTGDDYNNVVYKWTVDDPSGGTAIFTQASTVTWSNLQDASFKADVDTQWGFGDAVDNATNTFTETGSVTVAGTSYSSLDQVKTSNSTAYFWETLISSFVASGSVDSKDDLVFIGKIHNDETSYDGTSADFQVLVPVNASSGATETYNVYVELE